jgi:GntR family histidine utilization transcriptional repressor
VALSPQRRAQMSVPILRQEVEGLGKAYSHRVISRKIKGGLLHLEGLHFADKAPFAAEQRQVNLSEVPQMADVDLDQISANEWLVQNAPFDRGTLEYAAEPASGFDTKHLECAPAAPLMVLRRETFSETAMVTAVRMSYAPGHAVRLVI